MPTPWARRALPGPHLSLLFCFSPFVHLTVPHQDLDPPGWGLAILGQVQELWFTCPWPFHSLPRARAPPLRPLKRQKCALISHLPTSVLGRRPEVCVLALGTWRWDI